MLLSITQNLRAWLIAVTFALVLFLGNIAVEALGDDLKEQLKPYRIWVWGVLGVALLVTIIGTILQIKKQRDSEKVDDNISPQNKKNISGEKNLDSIQNTGDNSTINQNKGGSSSVNVTFNNHLPYKSEIYTDIENNRYVNEISNVDWENRDNILLNEYFLLCSKHDDQYKDYDRWRERDIRERLIICGFAFEGQNGKTYLTNEGVIFCCQHGKIPQSTFFADVRLKYDNGDLEEAVPYNNYSILSLYFNLLKELTPLFQRGIEVPEIRDRFGSSVFVYDYPQLVIIEALVNFLIHRDYSQDDLGYITIYPNKIEFENPGHSEFSVEELLNANVALKPKYCRNQRLIQAFNHARLNQREGRGIQRIKEALEKNGSYLPDGSVGLLIENDSAKKRFVLTIYRRERPTLSANYLKHWQLIQERYYNLIEKKYGWTWILGKPEPIPLEGSFTDVYLLDKITAWRRFDILKLEQDLEFIKGGHRRLSGLDLIKEGKFNRLYILGKPGGGKTTFLKYIALKAAQNEIKKIPIFVSLKEWADSGDKLMDFLVKQFDICDFPETLPFVEYILETGQAIVLFDGLDETQQENGKRDKTIDDIRDFSRKYDKSQILITCRISATDYTFEEFTYLELADFNDEQVEKYFSKWFEKDTEKQKQFEEEFARAENIRLREMASTPLLLSLLCLNFEETGTLPERRVEIYEEGINALLHKWDSSRSIRRDEIYKGYSLGRKRQMFARIAAQMFENNEYFIPKRQLAKMIVDYLCQLPGAPPKEDIDGEAVLKSIEVQHSIFVERAKDIYSFSHLTFQEYFAAKYIVDNVASGTLRQLLTPQNITNNRWHEIILNTASLLDNANVFFEIFINSLEKLAPEKQLLPEDSKMKWINFVEELKSSMLSGDLANNWKFPINDNEQFTNFIDAIQLFNKCLRIAVVNRNRVISELFRYFNLNSEML